MEAEHPPPERLSDYERAVCYYTLPRTTGSINTALILVYGLCLLEAIGALVYGLVAQNATWTRVGTFALAGIIVFGLLAFTGRAILNEVRRRRALAVAHDAPEPEASELPDPFANHLLFRRPLAPDEDGFECVELHGDTRYRVSIEPDGTRRLLSESGEELWRVRVASWASSFLLEDMLPRRLEVFERDRLIGKGWRRLTLGDPVHDIDVRDPRPRRLSVKGGGIYQGLRLVGRFYALRDYLYLDVEESSYSEALLALLLTMDIRKARAILF
jgi:hypothetical protein